MKDKKMLLIFSFITIVLIFSLTLDIKDIEKLSGLFSSEKEMNEVESQSKKEEKQSVQGDENIHIKKNGNSIYLKANLDTINPITSLSWLDKNTLRFNYTFEDENIENIIYDYSTKEEKIEAKFNIKGIIWEWAKANKDGIIYSNDGFNGLFYMDNKEKETKISKKQEWYSISPDGKKVIVNGVPNDKGDRNERFIYDLEKNKYELANYIPDIDYVYSYIAATWSPDSTHIVSQEPGNNSRINIIDANKGIEKKINIDNSILTLPTWSEDGKKLTFLIQSNEYKDYVINDLEIQYFLSDKIGIYDVKTKKIKIIDLKDKLTTSRVHWSRDNEKIIVETTKAENAQKLLEDDWTQIKAKIEYINIKTKKRKEVLDSGIDMTDDYPVHQITPIKLFSNNILLFMDSNKDIRSINITEIDKKDIITKEIGYLYSYSEYKDNIYMISDEGIYISDDNLKIKELINFQEEYGENTLNVDAKISPDYKKIVLYVQYDIDSNDKTFIEIKKIK
ncbi:hypothetical protein [Senegalia sp. (in: firmicutes)]|uniref:hypothetical protein n=1 Tax=Senegalia sp. (in: firmicutes) TaxID=1924098 RepID=UPI003F9D9721